MKYFHLSRSKSIKQIDKWCHIHTNCETNSYCHLLKHSCSSAIRSYTKMYFFFIHRDTILVCSYWDMNIYEILDQFLYSEQWLWSVQKIQPEEICHQQTVPLCTYCDLTNAASVCHFLFQGKNTFPYLLQSTARRKGVSLLPLSTLGTLMQNVTHTTHSKCDLSEGSLISGFQIKASFCISPFFLHINFIYTQKHIFYMIYK